MTQEQIAAKLKTAFIKAQGHDGWLAVAEEALAIDLIRAMDEVAHGEMMRLAALHQNGTCGCKNTQAVEDKPQYRLLEAGEIIMKGDECCSGNLWYDVNHGAIGQGLYESNVGRYRRLVVNEIEYPSKYEMEELGEQRAMALDATVATNEMADELKKAKADLFAYGEFTTNVAAALGMGTYEISFADVIDRIRLSGEVNNKLHADFINHISSQKEKLQQAATYIEGLERDLSFHIDATQAAIADADFYRNEFNKLQAWQNAVKNVAAL